MGKAILIMSVAAFVGGTAFIYGLQEGSMATEKRTITYEEQVLAREIARAAANMARGDVKRDFTWQDGYSNVQYQGGLYTVTVANTSNEVIVNALGEYGASRYEIRTTMAKVGMGGAIVVDAQGADVNYSGTSFTITGMDTAPGSTEPGSGPGPHTHGIAPTEEGVTEQFKDELDDNQAENVSGVGGTPDIVTAPSRMDLDALKAYLKENADRTFDGSTTFNGNDTYGSPSDPEIVVVSGDAKFNGNVSGHGVLLVEGDISFMSGNFKWTGLVFVSTPGGEPMAYDVDFSGNAQIHGGVLLQSDSDSGVDLSFDIKGNSGIYYSSEALDMAKEKVPMIEDASEVVVVDHFEWYHLPETHES
jgi:hypothetical protein